MANRLAQLADHFAHPRRLFEGQVAIVTGGGQGVGAETARLLASKGARVVVADMDAEECRAVADKIQSSGGQAIGVSGDMTSSAYIAELVSSASHFGHGKIHIIVNTAGFGWDGAVHRMPEAQWETLIALHCTAPFRLARAAAAYFCVHDGEARRIINVSSANALDGDAGAVNYSLARAGVAGMSKTIAKDWGRRFGVRCDTITLGGAESPLTTAEDAGDDGISAGARRGRLWSDVAPRHGDATYADMHVGWPGSARAAASRILAVASDGLSRHATGC
ncbi:hypothetical protein DCS_03370 [Drechmeria coniospora]|uniref:3-oxoacyl-[acyl-carrier-protein] reductase n=1 Tax=Drechmeria coniospora TaxID=98403 RepID=A0A151GGY6_DRECN|nr:hypothetical protein DCS_03370 [Drechmeria coniospora]KYK56370.1 hypothetical protein DCS_03370 [Drechmeria coniospora]